jgi:ubiquinone biosynthesis protein COQ9
MFWRPPAADPLRDRLIEAVVPHVAFDGWSPRALAAAAADLSLDAAEAGRAFPDGALALIAYHAAWADRRMLAVLEGTPLPDSSLRARVARGVRVRLEQNAPAREAIRAALGLLGQPQNGPLALALLYRTCDAIWWAAGDTATDFSFYTKRALLAGVYVSTLLFWLNDRSEGMVETWAFLDRRIADVMRLQRLRKDLRTKLPDPLVMLRAFRSAGTAGRARTRPRPTEPPHAS